MSDVQLTVVEGDVAQVIGAIPGPQGPAGAVAAAIDGSAALPSIAFASDTDTGLYRVGANQLGVSTGGTQRLVIDETGQIEATSLGTAAAPTWTFVGDPNTGIYSPGADQLALSTNGTGRLFIDASGRVGLGTASPGENLSIGGGANLYVTLTSTGGIKTALAAADANGFGWAGSTTNHAFALFTNNTERARIDSSGRLLVGTSTSRAASGLAALSQVETTGYGALSLVQNSADAGGCVVTIGKTRSATIGGSTVVQNGDNLATIYFNGADGSGLSSIGASITAFVDGTPGANDMPGRLVFSTTADGAASPTERLRITSAGVLQVADAGNIAVGTTTGTKIGTATTQKLGFFNKTPVVQPAAVADATDAASVITQLNALLARMRDLGLIAT